MTDLMRDMLPLLSTEGDMGFLIAADEFESSNDDQNVRFARLLRLYVDIGTYVRMSEKIPTNMADEFKAINDTFENESRTYINGFYGASYTKQLGPFFLQLTAQQTDLAANLSWLERQPIRELDLHDMRPGNDLTMIFRNHRFQSLKRVTIRPDYRMRDVAGLAACMRDMTAHSLVSLTFQWGVNDRLGLMKAAFAGNKSIPKGAELFMQQTRVWVKK